MIRWIVQFVVCHIEPNFVTLNKFQVMNKILLGLLAGIAIGVALAPDKGSKTRQKIRDGFDDFKKKATDAARDFADEVDKGFEKVKTRFDNA
jgi:gas vesicle protein